MILCSSLLSSIRALLGWGDYLCKCQWNTLKVCGYLKGNATKWKFITLDYKLHSIIHWHIKASFSLWKHRDFIQVESNAGGRKYNILWIKPHCPHYRKIVYILPCVFINKNPHFQACVQADQIQKWKYYIYSWNFSYIWISMCSSVIYNLYKLQCGPTGKGVSSILNRKTLP